MVRRHELNGRNDLREGNRSEGNRFDLYQFIIGVGLVAMVIVE